MLEGQQTTINIVTACDNAYVQHTAIFLKSLFKSNPNIKCRVFVMVPNNFVHRASLKRNLGRFGENIEFLSADLSKASSLKVSHQVTVATYFRLLLDKLVPEDIQRIIYMDSDILVAGALQELWATDLENYAVAAAIDAIADMEFSVREKIGLARTSHYFNAGVLLIDLRRWKNEKLGERALAFAVECPKRLTWWDQCALNHVLSGRFKVLAKEWNFQTDHLHCSEGGKPSVEALRELAAAKIVHFTGPLKPWYYFNEHPMKWLYWKLLRETEWRRYCPPDRTGRDVLKRNLKHRAPALLNAIHRARKLWRQALG